MSFCKVHEKAAAELGEELLPDWGAQHVSSVGGPARHLVESWDYVEVCCGKNAVLIDACSKRGLRFGPKIDILLHFQFGYSYQPSGGVASVLHLQQANLSFTCWGAMHYFFNCSTS